VLLAGQLLAAEQETASQAVQIKSLQGNTVRCETIVLSHELLHRVHKKIKPDNF